MILLFLALLFFPAVLHAQAEVADPITEDAAKGTALAKGNRAPGTYPFEIILAKEGVDWIGATVDRTDWKDPAVIVTVTVELHDPQGTVCHASGKGGATNDKGEPIKLSLLCTSPEFRRANAKKTEQTITGKIDVQGGAFTAPVDVVTK